MRSVVVLFVSFMLAGCVGMSRDRWPVAGNWFHKEPTPKEHVVRPMRKQANKTEPTSKAECSVLDLNARRRLSEKCQLELKFRLARAAELGVEGHTADEIAAIMGISTGAASALIATTGSVTFKRK